MPQKRYYNRTVLIAYQSKTDSLSAVRAYTRFDYLVGSRFKILCLTAINVSTYLHTYSKVTRSILSQDYRDVSYVAYCTSRFLRCTNG